MDNVKSIIFNFWFLRLHKIPMCLLQYNLIIGYNLKYTFENLHGRRKGKWRNRPLDAIIAIFWAFGKKFSLFCHRLDLDLRGQP